MSVGWPALKQTLIAERGCKCEICGHPKLEGELQMHHAIYGRKKGHPEYDVAQNIALVCETCHKPGQLGYEAKQRFWDKQVERGYNMLAWVESLCLKVNHL